MRAPGAPKVWVVSELYHPEQTSTGYFMTGLAEGLATTNEVHVLCSQPTYSARGTLAPAVELRNGVAIERCAGTRFDKDRLALRAINLLTISISISWTAWRRVRRDDVVLVVTNPPTLPFGVLLAARARGARVVLRLEDVYPDAMIAAGALRAGSLAVRVIRWATRAMCLRMERVVVLGRDMAGRAAAVLGERADRIVTIPHWGAVEAIGPVARDANPILARHRIADRFVVHYMGNMGRTHGVDALAGAATRLRQRQDIHFLLIGWGARRARLERTVAEQGLTNVTLLPPCPREEVGLHLNAGDLSVIAFKPGMAGVSVPSRMYDVMAAGKPILALADPESELARVIEEERIGWVIAPDDEPALAAAIERAAAMPAADLAEMGRRARRAVEAKYTMRHAVERYRAMLRELQPVAS